MAPEVRRAIAFIVSSLSVTPRQQRNVFDYSEGKYFNFSGSVTPAKISVYDHDSNCYITGNSRQLFHYGNSSHIKLAIDGLKFKGYDYDSASHYSGHIKGNNVQIFDYKDSNYSNFVVR